MNETPTAGKYTWTRQLPKTGQIIEYLAGDDGTHEAGWWRRRLNLNNRTRFITITLNGDDIVIDRATGLMWPRDITGTGGRNSIPAPWSEALIYANGLDFAGFTDWRIPNVLELTSLVDFAVATWWDIFENPVSNYYWTSTTYSTITTEVYLLYFLTGELMNGSKIGPWRVICVRGGL